MAFERDNSQDLSVHGRRLKGRGVLPASKTVLLLDGE